MYEASTALNKVYQNQIVFTKDGQRLLLPNERPRFIDYAGTGVCKISKELQESIPFQDNPCDFPNLDGTLHRLSKGFKWHCHYPMHKHNKNKNKFSHVKEIRDK